MANIAINTTKLPILGKLGKGDDIIEMSTNNPNVPGNGPLVVAFTTLQENLRDTNAAVVQHRALGRSLMQARDAAVTAWDAGVIVLAAFTESDTKGDAEKILTTGFDVKATPSAPAPVTQILNVKVGFTGMPGHSKVTWKRETHAEAYVLERSPDPLTPTSWENLATVTEAKFEGNGTMPGQKYWFRVAGVNKLGQGPWSEPALRPVM